MTNASLELLCITVDENIANFISVVEKARNAIQENLHVTSNDIARADYFFIKLSAMRNGMLSDYETGRLKEKHDLRKRIRTLDINHQDAETVPTCAEIKDLRATYKRLCDKVRIEEQPDSPESEPGP